MNQDFDIQDVLQRAKEAGFYGFGGRCGWAAIAINRVLFGGQAAMSGAFNAAFLRKGEAIGHVAVFHDGAYWDSDATPKPFEDIESWGMLDEHDPDYQEMAEKLGFAFSKERAEELGFGFDEDEEPAYDVAVVRMTEDQILEHFPDDDGIECSPDGGIEEMEDILQQALKEHLSERQLAPTA